MVRLSSAGEVVCFDPESLVRNGSHQLRSATQNQSNYPRRCGEQSATTKQATEQRTTTSTAATIKRPAMSFRASRIQYFHAVPCHDIEEAVEQRLSSVRRRPDEKILFFSHSHFVCVRDAVPARDSATPAQQKASTAGTTNPTHTTPLRASVLAQEKPRRCFLTILGKTETCRPRNRLVPK